MPWYRRMAWCFYPRILVLGMGRFQGSCSFILSVANSHTSQVLSVSLYYVIDRSGVHKSRLVDLLVCVVRVHRLILPSLP